MLKTAFSTVACPEWTLSQVARAAADFGYEGVELRTFGSGSTEFACDPALTGSEKLRAMFTEAGVDMACLATSVSFDEPIRPPVIGRVKDTEAPVRAAKWAIDLAAQVECPLVRVFAFERVGREKHASALARIVERLALAVDGARNTGVRVVLENGGSFPRAADTLEIIDRVGSPLLGAAYSMAIAVEAGEDPVEGLRVLGDRVWTTKIKDRRPDGQPAPLGTGELPCRAFVRALMESGYRGWLVYEWDRAWIPGLDPAHLVLPSALRRIYEWSGMDQITTATSRTARV